MTTLSLVRARLDRDALALAAAVSLGVALVWAAGFAHATALHDAAHDQRHAIAFPCH